MIEYIHNSRVVGSLPPDAYKKPIEHRLATSILPEPVTKGLKSASDREVNKKVDPKQRAIVSNMDKFIIVC